MLPLRDENPTRRKAIVTVLLIGVCVFIYFGVQQRHADNVLNPEAQQVEQVRFTLDNAAIPKELVERRPLTIEEVAGTFGPNAPAVLCDSERSDAVITVRSPCEPDKNVYLAVLFSMFLHGSLIHLGGNMLFLWVFGNNIEDVRGPVRYLLFYLAAGLMATAAHVFIDPSSTVPVVGASGAIAGVMGAYMVLFPNARITTALIIIFIPLIRPITAKWLLGFWFFSQFLLVDPGVAWAAHVGGFVFGVLAGLVWRATGAVKPRPTPVLSY